jgi:AraC family ethanolamine operon transcriptional activator
VSDEPLGFDFDQHGIALREGGAEIIFTSRSQANWGLNRHRVKRLVLERRYEGGASIIAGTVAHDSIVFAVMLKGPVRGPVLNGQRLGPLDLVVIPPALELIKASIGPHAWLLVSLSRSALAGIDELFDLSPLLTEKQIIVIRSPTLSQKIIEVADAVEREFNQKGSEEPRSSMDELEQWLIETVSAVGQVALLRIDATRDQLDRRSTRACELAQSAVKLIGNLDPQRCQVSDFCAALGATQRELRRSFKSYFAMGPTRLARLHKVNLVRRLLVDGVSRETKIMDLLASADVSEPGRFSGQYKAIFGESPSVTRKRLLAQNNGSTAL